MFHSWWCAWYKREKVLIYKLNNRKFNVNNKIKITYFDKVLKVTINYLIQIAIGVSIAAIKIKLNINKYF